jgi:Ser/Thr protein kinase RdoA (MazF antagonist)
VRLRDGRETIVKRCAGSDAFRRERDAYRHLAAEGVGATPRLLADDASRGTLLLEARPGTPDLPAEHPHAAAVHEAAGAWLARLHRARPFGHDPLPLEDAYRARADRGLARADGAVAPTDLARVRALLDAAVPRLGGVERVPCQRDHAPRNWLVEEGTLTAVIDFEHARDDLAEADLIPLAREVWPAWPHLRAAFLRGYHAAGGPADPAAAWMPALIALDAVSTVAWAIRHRDGQLEAVGRQALARALASR